MHVNIGKGITLDVVVANIPQNVMDHVVAIGLRNILMDCHAGITKADNPDNYVELSRAKAEEKLAAMYAGDIRKARATSGVSRDPVRAEALKLARRVINSVFTVKRGDDGVAVEHRIVNKQAWVDLFAAYSDDYNGLKTNADMGEFHAALVDAQADTMMEEAEAIIAAKDKAKAAVTNIVLPKK